MGVSRLSVTGSASWKTADGQMKELRATARPLQETYQPGGGRGHWPVSTHVVSVGAPSDLLAVKLSQSDLVFKPGESKRIDVEIKRAAGFTKNVTLDVVFKHLNRVYGSSLPEGVTVDAKNSKTLLTGKTTAGYITLKAADTAPPVERQIVPVMASVAINFVMKAVYASEPLRITVVKK